MSDDATRPDIQHFTEDGTWIKPSGARRITVVLKGGNSTIGAAGSGSSGGNGGGGAFFGNHTAYGGGGQFAAAPAHGANDGELVAQSLRPDALPSRVDVRVGEGGFALIVTHLAAQPEFAGGSSAVFYAAGGAGGAYGHGGPNELVIGGGGGSGGYVLVHDHAGYEVCGPMCPGNLNPPA